MNAGPGSSVEDGVRVACFGRVRGRRGHRVKSALSRDLRAVSA
ncbi:hypothetical protein I546_4775 [Mycobacterium kansasii 732]|nr:hypothetical protein I546_4775 [Mycobacterium kansasii 732]